MSRQGKNPRVSVAVIKTMTKATCGGKASFPLRLPRNCPSGSERKRGRAGMLTHYVLSIAPGSLPIIGWALPQWAGHSHNRLSTPTMGWALPKQSLIKEMHYRFDYKPISQ